MSERNPALFFLGKLDHILNSSMGDGKKIMGKPNYNLPPGSDPIREKNEEILRKLDRYRAELAHAIETGNDFYTHPFKLVKPIDKETKSFVLALIVIALLIALKDYLFPEFR